MEMMTGRTLFQGKLQEYDQKEVEICGWVKVTVDQRNLDF